ncbi:GGDEF domain-containing protein [Thaumasiovibrio subtropicus]|uniref:GGDEF domain-containing protein n=1 Tax=Thaumasiovibrio subtropicus TaxID=1891207 RepID=UPI00131BEBAD|nr:GGDEF domain-containing protein [Thaumasiovibrio subtropicus]
MKHSYKQLLKRTLVIDLIVVFAINVLLLTVFIRVEFLEWFYDVSRKYEDWELDEVFSILMSLGISLIYFAVRRWRESQKVVDTLQHYLSHDYLTDLFNRRYFDEKLRKRARVFPVGVILLDLDNFKLINDQHGHQTGDDVLKRVARTIEPLLIGRELAARWGGEEFCILTTLEEPSRTEQLAEEVRIALINDRMLSRFHVSASIGFGTFTQGTDPDDIFRQVDHALYSAKNAGKNCTKKAS